MATFVDDYSRKKFTYMMKTKSKESALRILKRFQNEVLGPVGTKMKILRTDNDGAFVNDEVIDYLCEHHVVREYTSDYTPQQNGVVETAIRDIKNLAVTLMNAANLHSGHASLYGQAILIASLLMNDAPHVANNYKSPNEVLGVKGIPLALIKIPIWFTCISQEREEQFRHRRYMNASSLDILPISRQTVYDSTSLVLENSSNFTNFTVIDGLMLWNKKKVRFDDVLEVNGTDNVSQESRSILHPDGNSNADTDADPDTDDDDEVNLIVDDLPDDDMVVVESYYSLPTSSEGEYGLDTDNEVNSDTGEGERSGVNEDLEEDEHTDDYPSDEDSVVLMSEVEEEELDPRLSEDDEDIDKEEDVDEGIRYEGLKD